MNTANRLLWTVIGLLLAAAGGLALAIGVGWIPAVDPGQPVWPAAWSQWWQRNSQPAMAVLAAVAVLAILAGVYLVRRQLRTHAAPTITRITGEDLRDAAGNPSGHISVRARALSRGTAIELARHRHIANASVALSGKPATPTLDAHLEVAPQATIDAIARHVNASVRKLATTLGQEPKQYIVLSIENAGTAGRRVN